MRLATTSLLLISCQLAFAADRAIVFDDFGGKPNAAAVRVADAMAEALNKSGLMEAMSWSFLDPSFRDALLASRISDPPESPTLKYVMAHAGELKANYVFSVSAKGGATTVAIGKLFRDGRQIWSDKLLVSVKVAGKNSQSDEVASIANTWIEKLRDTVFPKARTAPVTPVQPEPGLVKPNPEPKPKPPVEETLPSNDALRQRVDAFHKSGSMAQGLSALREAVDAQPFDLERRSMLANWLLEMDQPQEAARQAQLGLTVDPANIALRIISARAWVACGNPQRAEQDLNEAIARKPKSPLVLEALAETAILRLKGDQALDHLNQIPEKEWSSSTRSDFILACMLVGHKDELEARLTGDAINAMPLRLTNKTVHRKLKQLTGDVRAMMQQITANPATPDAPRVLQEIQSQLITTSEVLAVLKKREFEAAANGHRELAQNLLSQSVSTLLSYLQTKDEDSLSDARIDLNEAIRHLDMIKEDPEKPNGK
ncbi:MAG: hypothetical protein JSS72_13110 [Armatimonadetes bacterium]|nr:hypothetical protein [Armatimonadota bacterium]